MLSSMPQMMDSGPEEESVVLFSLPLGIISFRQCAMLSATVTPDQQYQRMELYLSFLSIKINEQ